MTTWFDARHDAVVVRLALPDDVDEAVTPNEDGTFTIFINERISEGAALRAYHHALRHIQRNDFDAVDVQTVEAKAVNE